MKEKTSNEMIHKYSNISIKEIIECHLNGKRAPKSTHDEGYYEYKIKEKKEKEEKGFIEKGFVVCWIYDFINNNYYGKTICEITDYKEAKYKILKKMYGDY